MGADDKDVGEDDNDNLLLIVDAAWVTPSQATRAVLLMRDRDAAGVKGDKGVAWDSANRARRAAAAASRWAMAAATSWARRWASAAARCRRRSASRRCASAKEVDVEERVVEGVEDRFAFKARMVSGDSMEAAPVGGIRLSLICDGCRDKDGRTEDEDKRRRR